MKSLLLLILLSLTVGCSRDVVTREQYLSMNPEQRELVVRSLLGGEQAEDAKGNRGSRYTKRPEHYRAEIDRMYAAGDQRPVTEIWKELKD